MVWAIARFTSGNNKQTVLAFGGFVSKTGNVPKRLTTIDYYPMIHAPFKENSTMKEILSVVGRATREVQQDPPYPIQTLDLGGVMKMMPVIWNENQRYQRHIILIGTCHKMIGSGYSDLLQDASIVSSGCVKGLRESWSARVEITTSPYSV